MKAWLLERFEGLGAMHLAEVMCLYSMKDWEPMMKEAESFRQKSESESPWFTKKGVRPALYCLGAGSLWGRNDPVFDVAEAAALKRDVPKAEVHLLDAGHFALDESASDIARLMRHFMARLPHGASKASGAHI